jgi:Winged helix-turn helix
MAGPVGRVGGSPFSPLRRRNARWWSPAAPVRPAVRLGRTPAFAARAMPVAADEDTVRDVIHAFNAKGSAALDTRWAGARPRRILDGDIASIIAAAKARPDKPGRPFTC